MTVEIERAEACTWTQDWNEWQDIWHSTCDQGWSFNEGGPIENQVRFCHWCGGLVTVKPERRDRSGILGRRDDEPISHPDRRSGADRRRG